jgi:hypothetical protein
VATNLGITTCDGFQIIEKLNKSVPCSVSGRVVSFTTDSVDVGTFRIGVRGVTNPTTDGGIGSFKILSYYNALVMDKNEVFPGVGMGPKPVAFTLPTFKKDGLAQVRYTSLNRAKFTFSAPATKGSWVRVTFATDYIIPAAGVSCVLVEDTAAQNPVELGLSCAVAESGSLMLNILNLPSDYAIGKEIEIKIFGVTNPGVSGTTATFTIEVLEENTTKALLYSSGLPGIEIREGTIGKI